MIRIKKVNMKDTKGLYKYYTLLMGLIHENKEQHRQNNPKYFPGKVAQCDVK